MVLAIPRGGVVVGFEIARKLGLALDVIVPRKLGAPNNPELAIGAIAEDGSAILDESLVSYLGVSEDYIRRESERQKLEIRRRLALYRQGALPLSVKGRNVLVVDDGIATGSTMKAALVSLRRQGAKKVVVAVPVGPPSTIVELHRLADKVVCLYTPEYFQAIGQFYEDFSQTEDEDIKADFLERQSLGASGRRVLQADLEHHHFQTPRISGGDLDADWQSATQSGEETVGGSAPTPDQDRVDELGKAVGLTYSDEEPLQGEEKLLERDRHRWELDPASAEDFDAEEETEEPDEPA